MKYIVYLTTNTKSIINGQKRIYIGVHKTETPEIFDGYLGCGVYCNLPSSYKYPKTPIQYAIKKYGPDAFIRQTLYTFETMEEALKKEAELVTIDFIKLEHVYNACIGGFGGNIGKPLYQFDLEGNLVKEWKYSIEAYDFYGYSKKAFEYAVHNKHPFLNSLWSREKSINIIDYKTSEHGQPKKVYLYTKEGKMINEFYSMKECSEFLNCTEAAIQKAVSNNRLVQKKYYISDKLVDIFIPKARKEYCKTLFYVYQENPFKLIGKGIGKEIMPLIDCYSWNTIRDVFRYKHNWYKNFYISEIELSELPKSYNSKSIRIDVFDKYGNFIETLNSVKETREKYKIHSSKIKNIQLGDKYIGNYIFKWHSK